MNKGKLIDTVKFEQLSNEELSELLWMINKDQYKERPVTINEFIDSNEFIHKKWDNIYPIWRGVLNEIYPTPFNAPYNEILISAAAGSGKCLGKGTPILMYDGTIKNVEDIQIGDLIMGDDSTPRKVLSVNGGKERMYDVIPLRGGMTWSCNESHILSLKCSLTRPDTLKYRKNKVEDISVKDYIKTSKRYKEVMKLYRVPIEFHNDKFLEIDPYIYGLWLGDGITRRPSLTNVDEPIIKIWCEYAKTLGLNIRVEEDKRNPKVKTYHCTNGNIGGKENIFYTFIKQSTQTGHKRILHKYKTASRENRLRLLAGIIDTDGYKEKNRATLVITTKYKDLAEDYLFLVRSLGFRGSLREKHIKLKNEQDYICYNVSFAGELSEIPIVLERKQLKREFKDGDPLKTPFKLVDKGIGDYYGFTIDGNHRFVLGDFTVTHNTVTATIGTLYDMYKLGCLKDPCSFYGLASGTMLIMAVFSATGSTSAVNWQDITTGIEACPWMMSRIVDKRGLEKKNGSLVPVEILDGVFIQTGSKFQHSMGKAIFDGLMDEAAFGGDNLKDAQKTYNELSSRMATRFRKFSKTGNLPGHLFLISSPKEAGDFMQDRINKAKSTNARFTLVKQNISSWDADPRNDSDDKFTVFVGNEFKEPKIYEEGEKPSFDDIDYLIYPPKSYLENFRMDLLGSIMNYGGVTTIADTGLFKSPSAVNDCMILKNPFNMNIIQLPFAKDDVQLMDFMDMSYFKDIRHPEANRFVHIDVAFSSNTLDRYGIAAGYCTLVDRNIIKKESGTISDVYNKADKIFYIDWAIGIEPCKGQEVPLSKVEDFLTYLIKKLNYPIVSISADTFNSKQTLQNLEQQGYETMNISVDRTRDPYLHLKQLIYNKQIFMPQFPELKTELLKLRDNGKKIDHVINGCFTGDTLIRLVDGRDISIIDLLKEQEYKQNWVYTFNETTQKIEPKPIKKVFQTKITKNLVKVTLDNGEIITCTPEHKFMLRDGSYEEIQNLTIGTSLMPLYTKVSEKGLKGYRMYYEPIEDKWHYEHRNFSNPTKEKNVIHHCNYNKLDNTPTNLKPMNKSCHRKIHNNSTQDYNKISVSLSRYHKKIKNTDTYKQKIKKISQKVQEHHKKVFESLNKEEQQKKLNKNRKLKIKAVEKYFNICYNKLSYSEKQYYSQKYVRIMHPEFYKNVSNKLSNAHKQGKFNKIKEVITQKRWVTNGIDNKYIFKNEEIPNGYRLGRTLSNEHKKKLQFSNQHLNWTEEQRIEYSKCKSDDTSNRIWITNGTVDKYINKNSEIPKGFYRGRSKVGKNHKIVAIEYFYNICRVYDLEIEDNHNFALSSGVFVHNSKDISDAVAGCIWNCSNSNRIVNLTKLTKAVLNPNISTYKAVNQSKEELVSAEYAEFEKYGGSYGGSFNSNLFKGL